MISKEALAGWIADLGYRAADAESVSLLTPAQADRLRGLLLELQSQRRLPPFDRGDLVDHDDWRGLVVLGCRELEPGTWQVTAEHPEMGLQISGPANDFTTADLYKTAASAARRIRLVRLVAQNEPDARAGLMSLRAILRTAADALGDYMKDRGTDLPELPDQTPAGALTHAD